MSLPISYEGWVRMGKLVPLRDGRVFYVRKGLGFPVIMMEYFGGNAWWYSRIIDALMADFSVYAMDLPGHGESDTPPRPYNPVDYAHALLEFMDQLKIDRAHLVGGHGSALVSAYFAGRWPSHVAKMVLQGISAWTLEEGARQWAEWVRLGWVDENDNPKPFEQWGGTREHFPGLEPADQEAAFQRANEDFARHGRWWASTMKEALKFDVHPILHLIQAPTLLVNTDGEGAWIRRGEQRVLEGIKGSRLEVIAETPSRPAFVRPDVFNKLVLDFLKASR